MPPRRSEEPTDPALNVDDTAMFEPAVHNGDAKAFQMKVKYFQYFVTLPLNSSVVCPSSLEEPIESFTSVPPALRPVGDTVKGRLRSCIPYWEHLGANSVVLDILRGGYKIPLLSPPPTAYFENNRSALSERVFVDSEVIALLESGRVRELSAPPHIVNPLTVSKPCDKLRLILDLTYLNDFVVKQKIKFDDLKLMGQFINRGSFLFKFDIKQGYHHVDIFPEHQCFLGFAWTINGRLRYFVFTVLPFGLTSGPFCFTKVLRCLVKYWRKSGVQIGCFLDDGLGVGPDKTGLLNDSQFVRTSLQDAGFVVNEEKSIWQPTQNLVWLGFELNTALGIFRVSNSRVTSLLESLQHVICSLPYTSARKLAKLCGKLISTKFVLGNIVQLKTRRLYNVISAQPKWDSRCSLLSHPEAVDELFFWRECFVTLNSRPMDATYIPPLRGFSDASSTGLAGYLAHADGVKLSYRNFSQMESESSSTWRELEAIRFSIESFAPYLQNKTMIWHTDNYAASLIVVSGSNKRDLQLLSENVFNMCRKLNLHLTVKWIPRDCLSYVDFLSKQIDHDDWQTTKQFFHYLNHMWGPFTIDRFADASNSHLPRFNSKFVCPGTEGIDAFTQFWGHDSNYLVPPVSLVSKVLKHMRSCKAHGVLVIPLWYSAAFWPQLIDSSDSFKPFIKQVMYFENPKICVSQGRNDQCAIGSRHFKSPILALRISFTT